MKSNDISVKRQAVDIDPLAILLSAPPKSDITTTSYINTDAEYNSVTPEVTVAATKPVVFDTAYFTEKFAAECR